MYKINRLNSPSNYGLFINCDVLFGNYSVLIIVKW